MNARDIGPTTYPERRGKASAAKSWLKAIELTSRIEADPFRLFVDLVEEKSRHQPDRAALVSEAETFSYRALSDRIDRYARWALSAGIKVGEPVCLMMPSRPDYIAAWLGITKIGGVVALINTKLIGRSLAHCINLANADHVIVADDLAQTFETALPYLERTHKVWTRGEDKESTRKTAKSVLPDSVSSRSVSLESVSLKSVSLKSVSLESVSLDAALERMESGPLTSSERRGVTIDDRALLIYTSGTTGLPKAASISHRRILNWAGWFAGLTDTSAEDRLYNCLPVYHSVGGIVAPCSMLSAGASVVLSDTFSVSHFWHDIRRWDCTSFQYIGELCRYLLNAPVSEFESQHRLRLACGNGLRGDVWEAFQARFAIPQILEFYAATEGNFSLYNVEGKPGAIGRVPPVLAHRFPAAIIEVDAQTGLALRGADGLCRFCDSGETGEAVGRIGDADKGGGHFEGYTDKAETDKKILRDVAAKGDAWFRTGDLMSRDASGYFRFVDRVGDTFRWKGENVSTSEVNQAVMDCTGIIDAATYGVEIPGADGRAGMTALVASADFDPAKLHAHLAQRLPAYARPVFLRCCATLDLTETFKQKKYQLAAEGFDPGRAADAMLFWNSVENAYRPLNRKSYDGILDGSIRL